MSQHDHDILMDYLYDELAADERAAFERRIASDQTLKAEVESFQMTRAIVQRAPAPPQAPQMLMYDLMREARAAAATQPKVSWFDRFTAVLLRPSVGAAALALVLVVTGYVITQQKEAGPAGEGRPVMDGSEMAIEGYRAPLADDEEIATDEEISTRGEGRAAAAAALDNEYKKAERDSNPDNTRVGGEGFDPPSPTQAAAEGEEQSRGKLDGLDGRFETTVKDAALKESVEEDAEAEAEAPEPAAPVAAANADGSNADGDVWAPGMKAAEAKPERGLRAQAAAGSGGKRRKAGASKAKVATEDAFDEAPAAISSVKVKRDKTGKFKQTEHEKGRRAPAKQVAVGKKSLNWGGNSDTNLDGTLAAETEGKAQKGGDRLSDKTTQPTPVPDQLTQGIAQQRPTRAETGNGRYPSEQAPSDAPTEPVQTADARKAQVVVEKSPRPEPAAEPQAVQPPRAVEVDTVVAADNAEDDSEKNVARVGTVVRKGDAEPIGGAANGPARNNRDRPAQVVYGATQQKESPTTSSAQTRKPVIQNSVSGAPPATPGSTFTLKTSTGKATSSQGGQPVRVSGDLGAAKLEGQKRSNGDFQTAMDHYERKRYDNAVRDLKTYLGRTEDAKSKTTDQGNVPQAKHTLAKSYEKQNKLRDAVGHYRQLLRNHPTYRYRSSVLVETARLEMRLGNYTAARGYLLEAVKAKDGGKAKPLLQEVERRIAERDKKTDGTKSGEKGTKTMPAKPATNSKRKSVAKPKVQDLEKLEEAAPKPSPSKKSNSLY